MFRKRLILCVCADPCDGLVRPAELVLVDPAEETLLGRIAGVQPKAINKKIRLCKEKEWLLTHELAAP